MIIGILQPNAEPLLSTCGGSLNSSPTKALLAFSLSRPTASSNDMAFRFSDAKIDSLSANFGSSALLAVEGDRKTTISAKFAFTARRSARQKGEPYNKCSIVTLNNRILWNSISYTGPKLRILSVLQISKGSQDKNPTRPANHMTRQIKIRSILIWWNQWELTC